MALTREETGTHPAPEAPRRPQTASSGTPLPKERHLMAQVLTVVAAFVAGALVLWFVVRPRLATDTGQVSLRLDRASPGAHLIWNIGNVGTAPITVTDLIIHGRHGATETMGLERPSALEPADHVLVPTDVNWT